MADVLLVALGRMGERYRTVLGEMNQDFFGGKLNLVTVDPKFPTNEQERHYTTIEEVPDVYRFKLAIDARPNFDRLGMLRQFLMRRVPYIIMEKPPASSLEESQEMLDALDEASYNPRVAVPFNRRFMDEFSRSTLSKINAGELKSMVVSAGAIGLGCNGIHYIDLANWLFDEEPLSVYSQLQLEAIPSPRGPQFLDHAGTLLVNYPKGTFILHLIADSSMGINTTLVFERGKIQILEQQEPQWLWYRQPDEKKELPFYRTHLEERFAQPLDFEMNMFTQIRRCLTDLMSGNEIPTLEDGHRALKVIRLAMESHQQGRPIHWQEPIAKPSLAFQFT